MDTTIVLVDICRKDNHYVVFVNGCAVFAASDRSLTIGTANVIFAGLQAAKVNTRWTDSAIAYLYPHSL